jgi:hypothetical protein
MEQMDQDLAEIVGDYPLLREEGHVEYVSLRVLLVQTETVNLLSHTQRWRIAKQKLEHNRSKCVDVTLNSDLLLTIANELLEIGDLLVNVAIVLLAYVQQPSTEGNLLGRNVICVTNADVVE